MPLLLLRNLQYYILGQLLKSVTNNSFKVEAMRQYILADIRLSCSSPIFSVTGIFASWIIKNVLYNRLL